ncbi:DUF6521 family protein [Lysinibacillus sp. OL1_EC]|uniref:three component ABC system middle component n=1 Tax=unclassified Lysinibacillus TaxID=2636778 RepID=UPI00103BD48E|nr:three component ABC system middle component [Lysinibacillus sp. OL1]MCM0626615.1 DUF6521 family protein [Lysinibacillus sp. OL1_EC]TBV85882.1 hypothetical protein EW028_19370 [Lysinibacillus sp. OL1]
MISSDIYASTNPAFCSLVLWHFLKGYEEVSTEGCELPILFLPIPIVLSKSNREAFIGTNTSTGLLTWLTREPQVLINIAERIESTNNITRESIIFGIGNDIISINNHGKFYQNNKGIVQKRLKIFLNTPPGEDLKEIFSVSKKLGNWCGQMNSSKIILNIMGLTL